VGPGLADLGQAEVVQAVEGARKIENQSQRQYLNLMSMTTEKE